MKKYINKKVLIISLFPLLFIFYNCGRNITYVEEIDYTRRVQLKRIECLYSDLDFRLKEISVLNAVRDTFVYRSHEDLSLSLELNIINNGNERVEFLKDNEIDNSAYFNWIIENENIMDTISFYYNVNSEYIIEPKDSLKFFVNTQWYSFEKLCDYKNDCTEDILDLLSNFRLIYTDKQKEVCVSQDEDTKIIVYNDKSKWSWW